LRIVKRALRGSKVVLITGASTGIGAATAKVFGREGYSVVINYLRSEEEARRVAREVEEAGGEAMLARADVRRWSEVEGMVKAIEERFGRLDVLVNNVGGIPERRSLLESDLEYWRMMMDLNLTTCYIATRLSVPLMIKSGGGVVVNVSSIAAYTGGGRGSFVYAAAKAAMIGLTRALSKELAPRGVRVVAVLPGLIDTPFHVKAKTGDIYSWASQAVHLGRVGRPEEVAEVIAFLASDKASYVTGATIDVNGGFYG
jgi:3-oxoacyl-[acyl-carrier protein] reductase